MDHDDLTGQLRRLLIGLADQEIRSGKDFFYDGGKLYADEVADLMFPSVLCIAQDLSERLGLGSFGYRFSIGTGDPLGFPLEMTPVSTVPTEKRFFEIAPFVAEVFSGEVMDCRFDVARLFESAARLIRPEFRLDRDTDYATTLQ